MRDVATPIVDFLEAGAPGATVMLGHSSVSGARQWGRLIDDLKDRFRVRAVNLFGYGATPPWPAGRLQTLDDQARLVEAALRAALRVRRELDDRVGRELERLNYYWFEEPLGSASWSCSRRIRSICWRSTDAGRRSPKRRRCATASRHAATAAHGRSRRKNSPITGAAPGPGAA